MMVECITNLMLKMARVAPPCIGWAVTDALFTAFTPITIVPVTLRQGSDQVSLISCAEESMIRTTRVHISGILDVSLQQMMRKKGSCNYTFLEE